MLEVARIAVYDGMMFVLEKSMLCMRPTKTKDFINQKSNL